MKATKIFTLFACLALVLTACQDDDFGKKYSPGKVGDLISFGGTSGYSDEARTVYGDKVEGENGYTEIKWYAGDKVRIYCEQAQSLTSNKYCDYNVVDGISSSPTNGTYESSHSSSLSAIGESGLRWGSETETHTFYGVYPAPSQLSASGADSLSQKAGGKLELNGNTLKGYLPNRQTPVSGKVNYTYDSQNRAYTIHPSMRYAYMVANNSVNPSTGYVSLTFEPIVTAVEITLKNISYNQVDNNPQDTVSIYNIKSFRISSDKVICGEFSTNIESRENTALSTDDTYKQIFIPTDIKTLYNGESVTFTAFLMLDKSVKGLHDLTVSIITESAQKSAKVNSKNTNGLIVEAKTKNFLNNIPLNLGSRTSALNANNWIKYIPNQINGEDVLVKSLSIPGAGGAASYTKYESNREYAQQSLTISQQWAQGIRCFEFAIDRPSGVSFGEQPVVCNGRSTGVRFVDAVDEVVACLTNSPQEFAMVIVTYENLDGWAETNSVTRSPNDFMSELSSFWNRYSNVSELFSGSTTMEQARGKLFCIARPSSTGQDDFIYDAGTYSSALWETRREASVEYKSDYLAIKAANCHNHILVVRGWGALKDKWIQRGYTPCVFHRRNDNGAYNGNLSKATGYQPGRIGRPFDVSTKANDFNASNYSTYMDEEHVNFIYDTQLGTTSTVGKVWAQEWARVVPKDIEGSFDDNGATKYFYWKSTIDEKVLRVSQTLEYALKGENNTNVEVDFYINSLCGYYVSTKYIESCKPHSLTDKSGGLNGTGILGKYWIGSTLTGNSKYAGMEGDIDTYSKYINNYFYKLISDKQSNGELNSGIGIVLMDRVSNSAETDPAGYYIPQIIWSNNSFN